jgi:hypothetical protein
MNQMFRSGPVERFRRAQTRKVRLEPLRLDLPADLAITISIIASRSGQSADQVVIDILRDVLGTPAIDALRPAEA